MELEVLGGKKWSKELGILGWNGKEIKNKERHINFTYLGTLFSQVPITTATDIRKRR
jgi:hypothetical protein